MCYIINQEILPFLTDSEETIYLMRWPITYMLIILLTLSWEYLLDERKRRVELAKYEMGLYNNWLKSYNFKKGRQNDN
jgi:hypothetical protein